MTLHQICSVAYVMMLKLIESRSQTMFISAVMARSMGNKDVEVVAPHEAREAFEQFLLTAPKEMDERTSILMDALFRK